MRNQTALGVFLVFGVLVLAGERPATGALPALVKKVKPAIVTVLAYDPDKAMPGIGTGFFIAPDTIVTSHHNLSKASRAEIRTVHGQTLRLAGIVAEDPAADLIWARVETRATNVGTLKLARSTPEPGEALFTVSNPLGLQWSASAGIVAAVRDAGDGIVGIQHTVHISSGSSGCPLMNHRGEVVAVQASTITAGQPNVSAGQGLNFAVPADRVARLKPGPVTTLAEFGAKKPTGKNVDLNQRINQLSLYPLTRDDFKAAFPFFLEATERFPDEPDTWFRLGLCYEKLGNNQKALEAYRKAADLNYDLAVLHNNLGAVCNRLKQFDEALRHLKKAVEMDPKQSNAHNSLAFAYNALKRFEEGAASAQEAVRLNPQDYDAIWNLGLAAAKLGDLNRAREQLKKLEEARPEMARTLKKEIEP